LKEEALDRTLRRTRFGRGYGPVIINKMINDIYAINNKREATATKYRPTHFCLFNEY